LGFSGGEAVAFVGAGGKTSLMFALARALPRPVCVTTTTHLGVWQGDLADVHYVVQTPEDLDSINFSQPAVILLTGPADDRNRLTSPPAAALEALRCLCLERGISLLVEADGARQKSLKAPAPYEPVIPAWVNAVVVVAGISALALPLDDETVHRPEVFSRLSGCSPGQSVGVDHLIRVLAHPQGGLKGIPQGARRVCCLNQVEGDMSMARANRVGRGLVSVYHRVVLCSLQFPAKDGSVISVQSSGGGVILAAGESRRLGQPKQLLDWQGRPFIRHAAETALLAGLDPAIVVTGAYPDAVRAALIGLPVRCVHNPDWENGQATSLKAGLAALPKICDHALFILGDQPQVPPSLMRGLLERFQIHRLPITAPLIREERRGNPVLFSRAAFNALEEIQGDRGGRAVFQSFTVDWLPWVDDRILLDVDREGDLEILTERYFGR
jgi:molybdenum cofactor cytidylyltransferase